MLTALFSFYSNLENSMSLINNTHFGALSIQNYMKFQLFIQNQVKTLIYIYLMNHFFVLFILFNLNIHWIN